MKKTLIAAALAASSFFPLSSPAQLTPTDLRVEYHANPVGLEVARPRLAWRLLAEDPTTRNRRQSAYQILVARSRQSLEQGRGDLWDSGKVPSDQSTQLEYAGPPVAAGNRVYWTVRTWDEKDVAGPFGPISSWSAGLLSKSDWQAQWIGFDPQSQGLAPQPPLTLEGAHWWWSDEGDPRTSAPAGTRYFRGALAIPTDRKVKKATLAMTADDNFTAYLNGAEVLHGEGHTKVHTADVQLTPGNNTLAVAATNGAGPAALAGRLRVEFTTGQPLLIDIDKSWKSSTADAPTPADNWNQPAFDDAAWKPVKNLAKVGSPPWGIPGGEQSTMGPAPYLRKIFRARGNPVRATAYVTALGVYELHLNGKRVGDVELAPGWTDYNKRLYYNTYDVTDLIKENGSRNAIGLVLGDGWYAGYLGYTMRRRNYGGDPRAMLQLELEYADGSRQTVVTDSSWRASYGPLRQTDLLMGTTYDANFDLGDWSTVDYSDAGWRPVTVGRTQDLTPNPGSGFPTKATDIELQSHPGALVKRQEEIRTKSITEPKPGTYVFDLGQNMVGWVRLNDARGFKGKPVTLRHAEMLNPDGTLYTTALRSAKATDTYIPNDYTRFTWEPQFTFHGFRYVEVTGLSEKPTESTVTGVVVHSDMTPAGFFECSNPLVNQLVSNIKWGQKGNYLEVPTDCPQRDERLGWTGDAQVFARTGMYNYEVGGFFTKWLVDLVDDSQMASGGFTHVAPALSYSDGGGTGWQDAAVICTYQMWQMYGDTRVIRRHYDSLRRYMDYLRETSRDFVRNDKPFGDWLNLKGGAKSEVIGTAYYAYVADLMSQMARAIGQDLEAAQYAELRDNIVNKFRTEFLNPDGSIKESSQTGYALAFTMGLIPDDLKTAAADKLVADIQNRDWHLATGFLGTPRLLPALTLAGRNDVAYRLLLQDTFPSWLFQVKIGATTMWERWDGFVPPDKYQTPAMNSFNHYAFGSVGQWLYETVAGIKPAVPGFKRITIAPVPTKDFTYARGVYDSAHGRIFSEWRQRDDGKVQLSVTIPPNTTATIRVPTSDATSVQESDKPAAEVEGLKAVEGQPATYEVGSGSYEFTFTP